MQTQDLVYIFNDSCRKKYWWIFSFIGVPTLAYGVGSWMLIKYHEDVYTPQGVVRIYFLNLEDNDSRH